ncbi:hypothetical protein [Crocinitomix catalasitica]|uniref:hypothetical protein n=1 Tax=Crocinitomix catalasitica TaxID=184607 RepID=UPI000482AAF9|nr:hypothetical protein [Crocinitomix catalasitica]
MKGIFKIGLFTLFFFNFYCGQYLSAQFYPSLGVDISYIHKKTSYARNLAVINENETIDYYKMDGDIAPVFIGLNIKSYGKGFGDESKFKIGYSLGLGYGVFTGESTLVYLRSSTDYADSIVNNYSDFTYRTNYHNIDFNHNFDVHWNVKEDLKFTNTLGFGLSTIVKVGGSEIDFDGGIVNVNHPTLNFLYQPQISKKYERYWLSYYLKAQFYSINLFSSQVFNSDGFGKIDLNDLLYFGAGFRFVFIPKKIEPYLLEDF